MAISSIQMFQNNGSNSIEGLLRAGPQAISEIMNQAIQIGRQMSDKQLSQEKDLLNMRQQENAMMQRRAENAQQLFTDTMKFDRAVGQDNRDYAANRSDRAFDQNRQTANDLFSQRMQERRLGLSEQRMSAVGAEDEAERKRKAQQLLDFENRYGGGAAGEPALPGAGTATEEIIPTSTDNPRIGEINKEIDILSTPNGAPSRTSLLLGGKENKSAISNLESERTALSKTPKDTVPEVRTLPPSASTLLAPEEDGAVLPPRDELASVEAKLEMLEKPPENASEKALTNFFEEKSLLEQRKKELTTTDKADAPKAPTAAAEERQFKTMVLDTTTFPDQRSVLEKGGAKPDDLRYAQADAYEKDKFENEIRSAINKSEDAYAALGGNPEERRKFHSFAMRRAGKGAGGSTIAGADDIDFMREL